MNQTNFRDKDIRRLVLVVEDEMINRELLGATLSADYDVIYAEDGEEALRQCHAHHDTLSLVLLDLMMPVLPGMEVLRRMKDDPELKSIPVIIMTADQESEVKSLNLGAVDFIPKPYPQPDVILARVLRTIELYEDREIISGTERDPLTGLYNRDYFYRYAEQFDLHHPDVQMDAIVIDVNHFHIINDRFGSDYGDTVLRRLSEKLKEIIGRDGGIVCRREADTFLAYTPAGKDYAEILENAAITLDGDDRSTSNRVRLRMGVYPCVDKTLEIERRFDRAKMTSDTVKGNLVQPIAVYDHSLHEKELYTEQLIEDFRTAIQEKQFLVYYQPKFDIRSAKPALSSAEALVRWKHPTLGMISPGIFIPLFEENGLIQELDTYVWKEAARQVREWKDRLGFTLPVSVNVSRIDMYDPRLVPTFQSIVTDNGIQSADLLLEITESAYTEDSEQIVNRANQLRKLGFRIEMDDFGTGYSSLNMISNLPIDVLKLDMKFIHNAFSENEDTRMLEVIIDIADRFSVPVIAEGVETEEQLKTLKALGCDIVQGYYFSKPVPPAEFEVFITEAKKAEEEAAKAAEEEESATRAQDETAPLNAVRQEQEEETEKEYISFFDKAIAQEEQWLSQKAAEKEAAPEPARHGLQLRTMSIFITIIALLAAVALFLSNVAVTNGYRRMELASNRYIISQIAASNMESSSDYLTDRVRCFVVTGEIEYLMDFFEEVEVTKRRDKALADLEILLEGSDSNAFVSLSNALALSNTLVEREYLAMRLMLEAGDYSDADIPDTIAAIELSEEDAALPPEALKEKAQALVFDNTYMHYKDRIRENVNLCTQDLIRASSLELEQASSHTALFVRIQTAMTIVFLVIVLLIVVIIHTQVLKPLTRMVQLMRKQENIPPTGVEELQFATGVYNDILKENKAVRERLRHEASHDPLTGLLNRGAYEMLLQNVDTSHMALILVDIDYFKTVNDTYGHDVGDKILKRVAEVLKHSFRSVDLVYRIGGDEFVVIMTRADSTMRDVLMKKINKANQTLLHPSDELPPVSLSVGAAFSDRKNPQGDIFKDADIALYRIKRKGRNGCEIY
ncbi:MAG: EAL domain-containing protein [Clostridiales bacterium]|nr:EAL domain-containing protein [Clostridiales bacterium]